MQFTKKLLPAVVAMVVLAPLGMLSNQAFAQQHNASRAAPRIEGLNVDEVRHLAPGVDLDFSMNGTPGGIAILRIAGATRNLALTEVEPGRYEGTYTISRRDKISARSPITANLRLGNQVASEVLDESLQVGVGVHHQLAMSGPRPAIDRFNVNPAESLSGGNDLQFTLFGTPGGKADLAIQGVKGKIILPEVRRGEYSNTYTIKNSDHITINSPVTAHLRVGERVANATLGEQLAQAAPAPRAPEARPCYNCGTIEAINLVEVKGQGNYLGTIGGGVVGALLGSQVGGGRGRTAAEIAGAVGGAYAGNTIEGKARRAVHYEVLVRMQNGATQTLTFAAEPGYRVGDKVQVNDGVITRT